MDENLPNGAIGNTGVSVSTSAVALPTTPLADRKLIHFQNLGDADVFLGGASVTSSNGQLLRAFGYLVFVSGPSQLWYGRTASGTADVRVTEQA